MNQSNGLNQAQQKPRFSVAITSAGYQKLINNTLGDPERAKRFIAAITSAVAATPALQDCDAGTILASALLGESLNLSPSPQLGQYYMVPFKRKDKEGNIISSTAQFILGYRGYQQLAQRSGYLRNLDALEVKQGEIIHCDPFKGVYEFAPIQDPDERDEAETVGYYAFFELLNGFRKEIFWSKKQMVRHADQFSQAFSAKKYNNLCDGKIPGITLKMIQEGAYIGDKELYKTASSMSSFWYKNFDDMAKKTMIRQLISKHGCPMSTEMVAAIEKDAILPALSDGGNIVTTSEDVLQIQQPESDEIVEQVDLNAL
jgi:recombination protein RecT